LGDGSGSIAMRECGQFIAVWEHEQHPR
jgi:hypothetical protein